MKHSAAIGFALLVATAPAFANQEDYVRNSAEIVKAADWTKTETIVIEISEHDYAPRSLRLKAGQPYKIVMKNIGEKDHYYTAPEFFRSVATRKAMVNGQAEIKAPFFTAFEMMKGGGQLDLYVVPVNKGNYPVYCTIEDHRDQGMEGTITVE